MNTFKHQGGLNHAGYKRITKNGRRGLEHRFVMEEHLGRPLLAHEVIHHINHNKLDNHIENLKITTASEHKREHPETGVSTRLKKVWSLEEVGIDLISFYFATWDAKIAAAVVGCSEMTAIRLIKQAFGVNSLRNIKYA